MLCLISTLCIVVIMIVSILIYIKIDCNENHSVTSSFVNTYTKEDALKYWNTLNCSKYPLSRTALDTSVHIGKYSSPEQANTYLDNIAKSRGCNLNNQNISIPQNDLTLLQTIWKDSNCSASFPHSYIEELYKRGTSKTNIIKALNKYVANIKANINANDYPFESLSQSFAKCYGNDWQKNEDLIKKYNQTSMIY